MWSTIKEYRRVPSGIRVVHKFGEAIEDQGRTIYYNDCGIVYAPAKPYLLCISMRGKKDVDSLIEAAKTISNFVYNEIQ